MAFDSVTKNGLFDTLKSDTAGIHKSIEDINPVLAPWFDTAAYAVYLSRLEMLYTAFEDQWEGLPISLHKSMNLAARKKSPLIARDLFEVGNPKKLPEFKIHFRCETPEELIGGLYVLEGSSLGGQIIYRHLKGKLGLEDNALNFFKGSGPETRTRWQGFKDAALSLEGLNASSVKTSALTMFETYGVVLKQIQRDLDGQGISGRS